MDPILESIALRSWPVSMRAASTHLTQQQAVSGVEPRHVGGALLPAPCLCGGHALAGGGDGIGIGRLGTVLVPA